MLASVAASFRPRLDPFLNCLISAYMETFELNLRSHIVCHIYTSYLHVKEVTKIEFSNKILLENLQFCYDWSTKNHDRRDIIFKKIWIANRDIRQRSRKGEYEPSMNGPRISTTLSRDLYEIDEATEQAGYAARDEDPPHISYQALRACTFPIGGLSPLSLKRIGHLYIGHAP